MHSFRYSGHCCVVAAKGEFMGRPIFKRQAVTTWLVALALLSGGITATAQNRRGASALRGVPALPPPENPVVLYTAEQPRIRVFPFVDGL